MAQIIQMLIGGVDYASYIDLESVSVDNNVIMTSDSCSLTVQLDGELPHPKSGQEFIWQIYDTVAKRIITKEFGGVIVEVQEETDGPSLVYTLTIKSYEHWLDRHLVAAWYQQQTPDATVKAIVKQFCPGFTTNNVQPASFQIIPQYFNYSKPSEALQNIGDQIEWGWYIDYNKDLHFYPAEFAVSPLPKNILDVDNDLINCGELVLTESGDQVYNKIFLKGFKTRSVTPMTLVFPCDGVTTQWSLGYRASSIKGDVEAAYYPSLSAYQTDLKNGTFATDGTAGNGGVQLAMAKDIIEGAPDMQSAADTCYIHYTQHLARVPNAKGDNQPLPTGYYVAVWFYYLKDQIFMGQDLAAQGKISKVETSSTYKSDGVYEYAQEDKSLTNSTIGAPQAKAELLLRKYGLPQMKGTFTSYLSGWRAGQYFTFTSQKRMDGLTDIMYVQRVTKTIVNTANGGYVVQSQVEFADSPYLV